LKVGEFSNFQKKRVYAGKDWTAIAFEAGIWWNGMDYTTIADWEINAFCDFKCQYCFDGLLARGPHPLVLRQHLFRLSQRHHPASIHEQAAAA